MSQWKKTKQVKEKIFKDTINKMSLIADTDDWKNAACSKKKSDTVKLNQVIN